MPLMAPEGYLEDESRYQGVASTVYAIADEMELRGILKSAEDSGMYVTAQGGLTGITGAAVPKGGCVVNLRNMQTILGLREDDAGFCLRAQPGCTLDSIRRMLEQPQEMNVAGWSDASLQCWQKLCHAPVQMFAPDLTETGATLGGVVSTNGSGARSFYYGATRKHIVGLRVVLPGGEVLQLKRGTCRAQDHVFSVASEGGRIYTGQLPTYDLPAVKHAAGLYTQPDMDVIDLFIGAEGTLGVITEVEIRLVPRPAHVCGITMFLSSEDQALSLVERMRSTQLLLYAVEYFSAEALDLLRDSSEGGAGVAIPHLASHWRTAIYAELDTSDATALDQLIAHLKEVGGRLEDTWLAERYHEIQTVKGIRHAIPERINQWIAEQRKVWPAVTKLGTDLAVPDASLRTVMQMYHEDLANAGLPYVIFGHIGNNHLHVNILPPDEASWEAGKALYLQWAERVVQMGGTVSAEHGIGKLKTEMLRLQFGDHGIAQMQAVKAVFDPQGILNPGTLFSRQS